MPASNSEARKRHEAAAATTDAMAEALSNVAIDQKVIAAMQKVTRILRTGSVEPTVYDLRRVAMMQVGHAAWRQASAEWHAALDVEASRIIGVQQP